MAQPRVLFMSAFDSSGGATRQWFAWRLVSGNNRELARSGAQFDDLESCLAAVKQLRETATDVVARVAVDGTSGQWVWTLSSSASAVARSSRSYQRERECRYGLEHFLEALPVAVVGDEVLMLDTGRNRRSLRNRPGESGHRHEPPA